MPHVRDAGLDRRPPLLDLVDVLGAPVVGLEAGEAKARLGRDVPGQRDGGLAGRDAAAGVADVDLDQHAEAHPGRARRRREVVDVPRIVDAHEDLGPARQRDEPLDLPPVDDLVRDEDVPDAPVDHRLGLAHLLAAAADRAPRDLVERDGRALVGLGVAAEAHRGAAERGRHQVQVVLVGVEVDHERRRVDLGDRHSDFGGRASGHGIVSWSFGVTAAGARPRRAAASSASTPRAAPTRGR